MNGKVAIVTGGAGGIGSEICRGFARRGTASAVADLEGDRAKEVADEVAALGAGSLAVEVDVANRDSVHSAVQSVLEHFGRVDFLVHCAGNNIKRSILELTEEEWREALDTHLTGGFLFCQAVGRELVRQGEGGRVVLISSVAGMAPVPERGAYSPAKAGLISLAQVLSLEWAQYRINVNAVCPGLVQTPMSEMVYRLDPGLGAERLKRIPMGRVAVPEEVADLVLFLCSDESRYINGAAIPVDGAFLNSGFMKDRE